MDTLTTKCMSAAQVLKAKDPEYYADVIRLLLSKEKTERKGTRGKRVVAVGKWTKGNQTNAIDLKWFEEQGRVTPLETGRGGRRR